MIDLLATGAMALALAGCQSPWSTGGDISGWEESAASSAGTPLPAANAAAHRSGTNLGSTSATSEEQAMAGVLDDLQQLGAIDPAAQQKLLEQLRATEPSLWPLVTQQFRASLAYHQQLVSAPSDAPRPTSPVGALPMAATAPAGPRPDARRAEPIGGLVDPRQLRSDPAYEQALAAATPAAIPVPGMDPYAVHTAFSSADAPPAFAAQVSASPLVGPPAGQDAVPPPPVPGSAGPQADPSPAATRARFDASSDDLRAVEPAILHVTGVGLNLEKGNSPHPGRLPKGEGDDPAAPPDWRELVQQAAEDLSRGVAASPQSTAEVHQHVSLRILQLLAGHTDEALRPIPHVSPAEQDYWSAQLFALATYLDHHAQPDDKRRAAASAVHLDEALADLRELGSLSLRNLAFCKNVYDYGSYEPCDSTSFAPGQQISLYAEVENYRSESTEKGYSTRLGTSYEILDDQSKRVDGGEFPDVEDCCRSRRRDFHIQYGLVLPKDLAPGAYRLGLVVKDQQSDKIGHASIAFDIRGAQQP